MKLITYIKRILVVAVVAGSMGLAIAGPANADVKGSPVNPTVMFGDGQEGHGKH